MSSKQIGWPGDDEATALPCGDKRYLFVGGPDRSNLEVHCAKCPSRWGYMSPKLDALRWLMVTYPPRRRYDSYGFMRLGPAPRAVPGQAEAFSESTGKTPEKPSAPSKGRARR